MLGPLVLWSKSSQIAVSLLSPLYAAKPLDLEQILLYREHAREMRKSNSSLKLFYGMSFETAITKCAGGVAEYRASEYKTIESDF